MNACIFPGQGSQYVGMGRDLYERSAAAREMFIRADELLALPLSKICFDGPEEDLKQTRNTQPAIFVHSIVAAALLDLQEIGMVAGHSLGEYSALVVGGAMTMEDGLRLVRLRGELMQRAGEERHGTMAAIVGLDHSVLAAICEEASGAGIVQCANFNAPGQVVVSGSTAGVKKAMEIAGARGARLVKELVVSGAFHSPLMESAKEELTSALEAAEIRDLRIPLYANVTGERVQKAGEIRTLLAQQLTSAVRWDDAVRNMIRDGASTFIEVGPGKVLQGLTKRIAPEVQVRGVEKFEDINRAVSV